MPAIKLVDLTLQDGDAPAKTILLPPGSDKASFLSSLHQSYLVEHAPDATTYELLVPDLNAPDMGLSADSFFHGLSTFLASSSNSAAQESLQATFPLVTFDGMGRAEIKDVKIRVTKRELGKNDLINRTSLNDHTQLSPESPLSPLGGWASMQTWERQFGDLHSATFYSPTCPRKKTGQGQLEEYDCSALGFDSWSFGAPLPRPIILAPLDAERCNITSIPATFHNIVKISDNGRYHDLSQFFMTLRQNDKPGTSEDALHTRDDALIKVRERALLNYCEFLIHLVSCVHALLSNCSSYGIMPSLVMQVISSIGGMPRERNKQSSGSIAGSRIDLWVGQPPIVAVEEKAAETELHVALGEIHTKVGTLDEMLPQKCWMCIF